MRLGGEISSLLPNCFFFNQNSSGFHCCGYFGSFNGLVSNCFPFALYFLSLQLSLLLFSSDFLFFLPPFFFFLPFALLLLFPHIILLSSWKSIVSVNFAVLEALLNLQLKLKQLLLNSLIVVRRPVLVYKGRVRQRV